jgi:hypothetical protein
MPRMKTDSSLAKILVNADVADDADQLLPHL